MTINLSRFILENDASGDDLDKYELKKKIIEKGQPHHLDRLINDPSPWLRSSIARRGFKQNLDKLVDDPHPQVRALVAWHGDQEHLYKLANDPDSQVHRNVAHRGDERVLDKMLDDPLKEYSHNDVIAARGTPRQVKKVLDIESGRPQSQQRYHVFDEVVKRQIPEINKAILDNPKSGFNPLNSLAKYGTDDIRHALIKRCWHKPTNVLETITDVGNEDHRRQLVNHPDEHIRWAVAYNTEDPKIIKHFLHSGDHTPFAGALVNAQKHYPELITPEVIQKHGGKPDVQSSIVYHGSPEHHEALAKYHGNSLTTNHALELNLSKEGHKYLLNHPSPLVRQISRDTIADRVTDE